MTLTNIYRNINTVCGIPTIHLEQNLRTFLEVGYAQYSENLDGYNLQENTLYNNYSETRNLIGQ